MNFMRNMMFTVYRSELGFDETIAALKESAHKHGWDIPMTHDLQETYQKAGHADMTPVTTLYFCDPQGGYRILQEDAHKPMAAMMPMGVSVYEAKDGKVYIAGMNLDRMSMMFGGTVKEVLRQGAANYAQALGEVATLEAGEEIQVNGGRCCLGCASVTAIVATLAGLLIATMLKVMPKIMAKMMPRMMKMMEEADVQPPCAQIILEQLEAQSQ